MRFVSTLSRVFVLALSFSSVSGELIERKFGADFGAEVGDPYVQGGYTVIDNSNFVYNLGGHVAKLTKVKWAFSSSPDNPPPTSVFIKVLKQKSDQPWRFTQVDQREIVVRDPTDDEKKEVGAGPDGYGSPSYKAAISAFWNHGNSPDNWINLKTPGTDFVLKTPGIGITNTLLTIVENEFVGFYFPDTDSQVQTYTSATPDDLIEWTMPGNFDWPEPNYSPDMRFTFPRPTHTKPEVCGEQTAITAADWASTITVPVTGGGTTTMDFGRYNAQRTFIGNWAQYKSICPGTFDKSNLDSTVGYVDVATNMVNWKEGFISRAKHRDFFGFVVEIDTGRSPPCTALNAGACGDPQFSGFQGQNFQFHGMADEVFNLISTPTFQMNGNFKYISAGKCDYNDTLCFTHPGTYVDQIGFMIGDIQIKAIAGSHEHGLRAWMNDVEIHRAHASNNHKIIFAINNSSTETGSFQYTQSGRLALDLPLFHIEVVNSDYFFNMEVSLKDTNILHAGAKRVKLIEKVLCASEGMKTEDRMLHVESRMAKYYPRVPIHGLIGQTWRNSLICDRPWVGDASDYVTSSLFASDSAFNYFGTQQ